MPIQQQLTALKPPAPLGISQTGQCVQMEGNDEDAPSVETVDVLKGKLRDEIAETDWEVFRLPILEKHDAALKKRCQQREGTQTDEITGIGSRLVLGNFVTEFKAYQKLLSEKGEEKMPPLEAIALKYMDIANVALKAIGVPELEESQVTTDTLRACFSPGLWGLKFNPDYIRPRYDENCQVTDEYSKQLANTTYHEARHCEQDFRVARWLAGEKKMTAKKIVDETNTPSDIVNAAIDSPLSSADGNPAELKEAEAWFTSLKNLQKVCDPAREAITTLKTLREKCIEALAALNETANRGNFDAAETALTALIEHKPRVGPAYEGYLIQAHESSAREVGYHVDLVWEAS